MKGVKDMPEEKNPRNQSVREAAKEGANKQTLLDKIPKNKAIAIILCCAIIGILITMLYEKEEEQLPPIGSVSTQETFNKNTDEEIDYAQQVEKRLEDILKGVAGLGDVEVMITLKSSSEKVLATDVNQTINSTVETDASGGTRTIQSEDNSNKIILASGSTPYVIREDMPQIEGAVIVATGADDITIKAAIIEAVSSLLNIPVHKVSVFKMETK
ncbi:MAG: hypothetical protein BEN19_01540 [Epulopiscium sp. Nuni2H_MBin003]|nr:MAG: hypothetical protein BEN19_01540 [Epulopiscium sp. Nuni2H_MBin003]